MIKFFRRYRLGLLNENKIRKYSIYIIGETFLLVIGILIALQINNWNENRKDNILLQDYRESLIDELKTDIDKLKSLDSINNRKKKAIENYFKYYNSQASETQILLEKLLTLNTSKRAFYTNAYTIEDLITTCNLSLFSESERVAILKLKNIHQQYAFYESSSIQDVALYEQEIKKNFDLVFLNGLSKKKSNNTENWKINPESKQFQILNNAVVENLKLYELQSELYKVLTEETLSLLDLL